MKTQEITTTNLSDFGSRERGMLVDLLTAWREQGLPHDFDANEVQAMMNRDSGWVFLTNSEFQVAMMNGDNLELLNKCSNCGYEGFSGDFQLNENGCNECNNQGDEE